MSAPSPTAVAVNSRRGNNSNNFRARYYQKLGIVQQGPVAPPSAPSPSAPSSSPPLSPPRASTSPPCLRHKRSILHTTPAKDQRVSFHPDVLLYRIKSHQDYSDEEWENMWVGSKTLDYEKDRNTFEFSADGADWRNATEEEDFQVGPDGSLVHPVTWLAYRQHWENGGGEFPVNFGTLLNHRPLRRYSPRPVKQRKTFWLLDLALESVQKGKNAKSNSSLCQLKHPPRDLVPRKPPRKSDRGWP